MKALSKKLLPLTLFGIAVTSLFSVQPAQGFTITMDQVGHNVVATGTGAINLTGLTMVEFATVGSPQVIGSAGFIVIGQGNATEYSGFTGPTSFGSGFLFFANSTSGDPVVMNGLGGVLWLPSSYVSNAALSDSMTFNHATITSLGLTPGTYTWTWGTGANQFFRLVIGPATVPDGGSTVSLLGFALLGLAALRRKLSC